MPYICPFTGELTVQSNSTGQGRGQATFKKICSQVTDEKSVRTNVIDQHCLYVELNSHEIKLLSLASIVMFVLSVFTIEHKLNL